MKIVKIDKDKYSTYFEILGKDGRWYPSNFDTWEQIEKHTGIESEIVEHGHSGIRIFLRNNGNIMIYKEVRK